MKRFIAPVVLVAAVLALGMPARAAVMPALPKPVSSFAAGNVKVDVYGTPGKRPLVFIPGLACGPWEWSGEIAAFAHEYTIYALTLPGFDGNAATTGDLFKTTTDDIWTMLQTRDVVKPVLIGHSLGGTLAIMLAEQHSDRLGGAIAVEGLPIFPGSERETAAQRAQGAQRMSTMIASASTPQQFEAAEKAYSLPYMIRSKSDIDAVAPLTAKSDPKAVAAWMGQDLMLDLRPQLHELTVPLLEIAPYDPTLERSTFPSAGAKIAYYRSLLAGAPAAQVQIVSDSRHFIMYDQPQALHAAIAAFLQAHP